jgi:hypothetical protein
MGKYSMKHKNVGGENMQMGIMLVLNGSDDGV